MCTILLWSVDNILNESTGIFLRISIEITLGGPAPGERKHFILQIIFHNSDALTVHLYDGIMSDGLLQIGIPMLLNTKVHQF